MCVTEYTITLVSGGVLTRGTLVAVESTLSRIHIFLHMHYVQCVPHTTHEFCHTMSDKIVVDDAGAYIMWREHKTIFADERQLTSDTFLVIIQ